MNIKSEKGITLTSLVIYVTAITIVLSLMATITVYFNKNAKSLQATTDNSNYLSRFNQYFIKDIENTEFAEIQSNGRKLILTLLNGEHINYSIIKNPNNNFYGIYRNKVKICDDILEQTVFSQQQVYNKQKISINLKIGETERIDKTLEYTINM